MGETRQDASAGTTISTTIGTPQAKTPQAKASEPEVLLYSSPTCRYCTMVKDYLAKKGLKYTEYDVTKDKEKAREMVMKTNQGGVPTLQINGRMIVGFDRKLIDNALSKPKPPKRENIIGNLIFDPFNL